MVLSPGLATASHDYFYNYDPKKSIMDDHLDNIRRPDTCTKVNLYNPQLISENKTVRLHNNNSVGVSMKYVD